MPHEQEQLISQSELVELCTGRPFQIEGAIDTWLETSNWRQRARTPLRGIGGTGTGHPIGAVKDLFANKIIAIDPDKIAISYYRERFKRLKEEYGLTDQDFGLPSSK